MEDVPDASSSTQAGTAKQKGSAAVGNASCYSGLKPLASGALQGESATSVGAVIDLDALMKGVTTSLRRRL